MLVTELLFEMNVVNLDEIKTSFTTMFDQAISNRRVQIAAPVRAFLIKRALKAMQNDEQGNMVTRMPIEQVPDNAPSWLETALQRNEKVYQLNFKEGFQDRLAHVIDWIAADQTSERAIRAVPEQDFLGHLANAADRYFAAQHAQTPQPEATIEHEEGRTVIATFRMDPTTKQPKMYRDDTLDPDDRGPVVTFWCQLTSEAALNREGALMRHCVGSYASMVAEQHSVIYSLRDAQNQPHVTVELNQRSRDNPSITQVKGHGNRPPQGTYAPYVRDLLNAFGIEASSNGVSDLRGMGLLTHKGKFGSILEVGGTILVTFKNGDSLRTLETEMSKSDYRYQTPDYWYVERKGTIPFTLAIYGRTNDQPVGIHAMTILRAEISRYPIYAANLIQYFNQAHITASADDKLEQIGVFYDTIKSKWGTREDLMEVIMSHDGIEVSRLSSNLYLSFGETIFATARLDGSRGGQIRGFSNLKVINDIPAVRLLPGLIAAFAAKFLNTETFSLMSDSAKATLLNFGLTRRTKEGFGEVPVDKTILRAKQGSVRIAANRIFFYDPKGVLYGSAYVGAGKPSSGATSYLITPAKLHVFGRANKMGLYQLLSALTTQPSPQQIVKIDSFNYGDMQQELMQLGFIEKQNRLVPLSEVQYSTKLPGGFTVESKPGDWRDQHLILKQGNNAILSVLVETEPNIVKRIESIPERASVVNYRLPLVALLNAAKVKVRRRDMLQWHLKEKNGKIYPQDDKNVMQLYQHGALSLGNQFWLKLINSYRFGVIEIRNDDERWGTTVVSIDWKNETEKDEVTYHMPRRLPSGVSRNMVISVTAKFMRLFHAKIEPYLSDNVV